MVKCTTGPGNTRQLPVTHTQTEMSRSSVSALLANCVAPLRSHLCALCSAPLALLLSSPALVSGRRDMAHGRRGASGLFSPLSPMHDALSPRLDRLCAHLSRHDVGLGHTHGDSWDCRGWRIHLHVHPSASDMHRGLHLERLKAQSAETFTPAGQGSLYLWQVCGSEEADLTAHLRALGAQHVHVGTCHAQHACGPSCKGRRQAIRTCWRPQRLTTATQFTVRACDGATT